MTEAEVREVADKILRSHLGNAGFDYAEVSAGLDHDGDPAFFVKAHFKAGSEIESGLAPLRASSDLQYALNMREETRFAYVFHHYPDGENPEGEDVRREDGPIRLPE